MVKKTNLKKLIIETLDNNKALDIVSIDLKDKSSIADHMIIASGTSSRHIQSLSEQVLDKFKENGFSQCKIEGRDSTEWKLVDGIDIVVHIFTIFGNVHLLAWGSEGGRGEDQREGGEISLYIPHLPIART